VTVYDYTAVQSGKTVARVIGSDGQKAFKYVVDLAAPFMASGVEIRLKVDDGKRRKVAFLSGEEAAGGELVMSN
jgi:hypothetical protein